MLLISVVLSIAGIAFALGYGFGIRTLKEWGKNEVYQAIGSAFLLGIIFILLGMVNGITAQIAGPCPDGCECPPASCIILGDPDATAYYCDPGSPGYSIAFDHATCFLDQKRDKLLGVWLSLVPINMMLQTAMSTSMNLALYQSGVGYALAPGLFPVTDLINLIMLATGLGGAAMWAQVFILGFIRLKLIIALPVGIFVRAFPFTRSAGAALIALVIGLYVVYPLLIILEIGPVNAGVPLGDISGNVPMTAVDDALNVISSLYGIMNNTIYYVGIVGLFLPVLNLTLTFSFVKEFARLLGGDIDVSALARLI
jgi:hypothetical protein